MFLEISKHCNVLPLELDSQNNSVSTLANKAVAEVSTGKSSLGRGENCKAIEVNVT